MRRKNHELKVRLNDEQFKQIEANLKQKGMTNQEFLENAIFEAKIKTPEEIQLMKEIVDELKEANKILVGVGNNINQIARIANANGGVSEKMMKNLVDNTTVITAMKGEVIKIWRYLK